MTLILAPVAASNSLPRRCSGSAICGPVKVMTLTVTPANGLSCASAPAQAAKPSRATRWRGEGTRLIVCLLLWSWGSGQRRGRVDQASVTQRGPQVCGNVDLQPIEDLAQFVLVARAGNARHDRRMRERKLQRRGGQRHAELAAGRVEPAHPVEHVGRRLEVVELGAAGQHAGIEPPAADDADLPATTGLRTRRPPALLQQRAPA